MIIAKRNWVLGMVLWGLMAGAIACNSQSSPTPELIASPTVEEENVVTVKYPNLHLSANGTMALLDTVNKGFQVYTIPDLTQQSSEDSYQNIYNVILSSSGAAIGIWTTSGELTVLKGKQSHPYKLPYKRARIRGLALADAGDRVTLLVAPEKLAGGNAANQGSLEIWSLPPGDGPVATIGLPLFDGGLVSANGDFSRVAVRYGNDRFTGVYTWTEESTQSELALLWEEPDPDHSPTDLALYNDWVWAVQAEGPIGWRAAKPPVQLPGNLRDRLRFSATGSHLLVYRVEKNIDVTRAEILFRLFDLSSATEVKQATHVVEHKDGAAFAVSDDLALFEVRASREAKLEIKELGW